MTGLPLIAGLGLALAFGIATLLGARVLARRAALPLEVRVVGEVPPVSDWLPDAVKSSATQSAGSSVHFADLLDDQILRGHRAHVALPADGVQIDVRTQPHLVQETRPPSHPLVIIVEFVDAPRRHGLSRLLYGSTPTAAALETRSSLQKSIARAARDRGLTVHDPRPIPARSLVVAASILIILVLLAMSIGSLSGSPSGVASAPSPTPWFPAGATECPAATPPATKPPKRTAVVKGTSCAFAQTVRSAYAKSDGTGSTVKLGRLTYDKKTKVAVTCTKGEPVLCKGGTKIVYLS
ncbi:MAG TPA: hypothetical protein VIT65_02855 [Microlunatus sp.]